MTGRHDRDYMVNDFRPNRSLVVRILGSTEYGGYRAILKRFKEYKGNASRDEYVDLYFEMMQEIF